MKAKASSRKKTPRQAARNGTELQQQYEKVRKERNRLRKELAEVKKQRDAYSKAVGALMAKYEWGEFDEEEVLAHMARKERGPSIEDVLAEIEARGPK